MEEEIDLGKYLAILIRRWWIVIGITLVCTLVAGAVTLLRPKAYKAHCSVAVAQPGWQVSFGTAIKVPSEDGSETAAERQRRMASLVALVANPSIAEAVLKSVSEKLPASDRSARALTGMVAGSSVKDTDLIDISVTYSNPDVAVAIANAWGQEYVRQVDSLYGITDQESYTIVHGQAQVAKAAYEESQAALEETLTQDRSAELNNRIAEYQTTIQTLYSARDTVVPTLLNEINRLARLRGDAMAMRTQVQAGGQAAVQSNGPALVLLKAQVFANIWNETPQWGSISPQARVASQTESALTSGARSSDQTLLMSVSPVTLLAQAAPPALQIQHTPLTVTAEAMVKDLDALVATLEERQSALKEELKSVAASWAKGEDSAFFVGTQSPEGSEQGEAVDAGSQLTMALRNLEQRVRELRAQLSQEESHLKEVQAQRDLAWESYDNLTRKEAELAITAQVTGPQVHVATTAAFARQIAGSTKMIVVAVVAGLLLGIVIAYALEFWQNRRARARAHGAGN